MNNYSYLSDDNAKVLFRAILTLENEQECEDFFSDLCTAREIQEMAQRLEVARLLAKGLVYADISKETGASTTTISRVNRSINYGAGGYSAVIEKLNKDEGDQTV
ncbi:MAG TPA: hypothetical protein IAD01_00760 [Candidatus Faeciplasma gallinarum]|uniref:TrpR-like protein YerC/YecD n=1 Tax=Candidatus Faeciplasma gallinarum TaxID=2840799 RepID=A0A9D1EN09_9FIRM|nr:hypothetical protein [Candidatus Faeciplasma gallinarum]